MSYIEIRIDGGEGSGSRGQYTLYTAWVGEGHGFVQATGDTPALALAALANRVNLAEAIKAQRLHEEREEKT